MDVKQVLNRFKDCPCGREHTLEIEAVEIGSGITAQTGEILRRNGFGDRLLLIADKNTLKASSGVIESLEASGFILSKRIHDDLRVAEMREVKIIEGLLNGVDGVVSVGTGSLHDVARLACANKGKRLCLFATAPSMDGFASYSAPITDGCFKITYPAKSPEVIIADTRILAAAPAHLKSAGFGDMVGKYVGLVDWKVSSIVSGEYYCERVAKLTRDAVDKIMALADRVTACDEDAARAVFEGLLMTGIGMSLVKCARPASGTEHILSHFWECKKLLEGKLSDFHGKKVGVATLLILEQYEKFKHYAAVEVVEENIDWQAVKQAYGELYSDVEKLNSPPITHEIDTSVIEKRWGEILEVLASIPPREEVEAKMKLAGCATTCEEIAVSEELKELGIKHHPHMRHRLSLMRLSSLFKETPKKISQTK